MRSAVKAATPVLVAAALAGILAPVLAPLIAAFVVVPLVACAGEGMSARRWRDAATLPLRFVSHVYEELGYAARVFVPVAVLGLVLSYVPGSQTAWIVRGCGGLSTLIVGGLAVSRPGPLRAGRERVQRELVGGSGRARRPLYAGWLAIAGASVAAAMNVVLTWPLPIR